MARRSGFWGLLMVFRDWALGCSKIVAAFVNWCWSLSVASV